MEKTKRWIDAALWEQLALLLPPRKPNLKGGRPRADDRACLEGILYVLRSGGAWHLLPNDYPSYPTCWRRLREWTAQGVWSKLQKVLLQQLHDADGIEWKRAVIDSASVWALFGGRTPAPARSIGPKTAANVT